MKRSSMVYLEMNLIEELREMGITNISELINNLLQQHINETKLPPPIKTVWDHNLEENKKKSDEAYQSWYKEKKESVIIGDD